MKHVSWTEIDSFYHVRKLLQAYPHLTNGNDRVTYRAKVKLHGTCAAISVESDGTVTAMSRTTVLSTTSDNAGFAKWVDERKDAFAGFAPDAGQVLVLFGEWCGPGVQKGVAVNQLKERSLVLFAARVIKVGDEIVDDTFIVEPSLLAAFAQNVQGCYVLPWFNGGQDFVVDWNKPAEELESVVEKINEHVLQVEECDPWMLQNFDVKGVGEGLVFYPVSAEHDGYKTFSDLCFKAKGTRHKMVAKAKPAQVDPAIASSYSDFAEMVCTISRLEQGVKEASDNTYVLNNVGSFLQWIARDIEKECLVEIEASGLELKLAKKACTDYARKWFVEKATSL